MDLEDAHAVRELDTIDVRDPERAHSEADDVLLRIVHPDVAEAYNRVAKRADWWAAA